MAITRSLVISIVLAALSMLLGGASAAEACSAVVSQTWLCRHFFPTQFHPLRAYPPKQARISEQSERRPFPAAQDVTRQGRKTGLFTALAFSCAARLSASSLPLAFHRPLGSLFFIQPERLDDSGFGQRVQLFGKRNHSKGRLVGVTEEVERVLRVFPAGYDFLAVVIDLR